MEFKTSEKMTHGSVRVGDWLVTMIIDENGRLRMRVENSKDAGVYMFESWTEGKAWAGEFSTGLIDRQAGNNTRK